MVAIKRIVTSVLLLAALAGCSVSIKATPDVKSKKSVTTTTTTTLAPIYIAQPGPVVEELPVIEPVIEQAPVEQPPAQPEVEATPGVSSDVLACIRHHESENYSPTPWHAYNAAGPYYGAYQWLQGSWDTAAAAVGRPDLVGIQPMMPYMSPADQDSVTLAYHNMVGDGPWGNFC